MPDTGLSITAPLQPRRPNHVAIIMDGNGRWARSRGLPRTEGHRRGIDAVRRTMRAARDLDIRYLTLFGFSHENWGRPQGEIADLMGLLRLYLVNELDELDRNEVRLRVIGDRSRFDGELAALIERAEMRTAANDAYFLTVALSYGGRQDIVQAARQLAEAAKAGLIDPAQIDEFSIDERLLTHALPDPDLLIRTSGEKRISNFLLWQCAYAELVFLETLWPDFGLADLEAALTEYQRRERRYGRVLQAACP